MPPGTHCKRFARDMAAKPDDYELTERQRSYVWYLAWRYRRQVPREVSDMALEINAGRPKPAPADRAVKPPKAPPSRRRDEQRDALMRPLVFGDLEQLSALKKRRGTAHE